MGVNTLRIKQHGQYVVLVWERRCEESPPTGASALTGPPQLWPHLRGHGAREREELFTKTDSLASDSGVGTIERVLLH